MSLVGFEPTISAGERPQTYALDRAATGTGNLSIWQKYISGRNPYDFMVQNFVRSHFLFSELKKIGVITQVNPYHANVENMVSS